MEFNDNYPAYETMYNHDEAHGKKNRRTLWNVFWIMLAITIVELIIGFLAPGKGWTGTWWLKTLFIGLTIAKAAAIVIWFMHLGHEVKFMKYVILIPYIIFMLYGMFVILTEGTYSGESGKFAKTDKIFIEQQQALKSGHYGGSDHSGKGGDEDAAPGQHGAGTQPQPKEAGH
jgi:cytochrome c oxidase subunit IV